MFPCASNLEQLEVRGVFLAGDHLCQHLGHDFDVASHYVQLTAQSGNLKAKNSCFKTSMLVDVKGPIFKYLFFLIPESSGAQDIIFLIIHHISYYKKL